MPRGSRFWDAMMLFPPGDRPLKMVAGGILGFCVLGVGVMTFFGARSLFRPPLRPADAELFEGRLVDFQPLVVRSRTEGEIFQGYGFTAEPFGGSFIVPGASVDRGFKIETLKRGTPVSFRVLPGARKSGKGPIEVCEFRTGQGILLSFDAVAASREEGRRIAPYLIGALWAFLAFCGYAYHRNCRLPPR